MTEFEKKIIEQNEQILKNQETLIEMVHNSIYASGLNFIPRFAYAFHKPYYMHHNMPLEHLEKLLFVRKPSEKKINGEVRYTTMLTPKGTVWLTKLLKAEFELDEAVA